MVIIQANYRVLHFTVPAMASFVRDQREDEQTGRRLLEEAERKGPRQSRALPPGATNTPADARRPARRPGREDRGRRRRTGEPKCDDRKSSPGPPARAGAATNVRGLNSGAGGAQPV